MKTFKFKQCLWMKIVQQAMTNTQKDLFLFDTIVRNNIAEHA